MSEQPAELRVVLPASEDTDASEVDDLARSLRQQILQLPVEDVTTPSAGPPPPGTKALDAATVGTLLVTMSGGGGLLVVVVETIRTWLTGHGDQRVVLELGGAKLELSNASESERRELVQRWMVAAGAS